MEQKFVHYISPWAFITDDGEKLEGLNIHYLEPQGTDKNGRRGDVSVSVGGDIGLLDKIKDLPAMYNVDFGVKSKKGKASLVCKDISLVGKNG